MTENYPRVEIPDIENVAISSRKGAVKISFEVGQPGPEILRLMYLSGTARPLKVVFESPQAQFDLKLSVVNIETGEVAK